MATAHIRLGHLEAARDYSLKSLALKKKIYGDRHPNLFTAFGNIGKVFLYVKDYDQALLYYNKAYDILRIYGGENSSNAGILYICIGEIYARKYDFGKAIEWNEKAERILSSVMGEKHPYVAMVHANNAMINILQGNLEEGEREATRSMEIAPDMFFGELVMAYIQMLKGDVQYGEAVLMKYKTVEDVRSTIVDDFKMILSKGIVSDELRPDWQRILDSMENKDSEH